VLGEGGGRNSARTSLFKQDLEQLAQALGLEIRLAPYPPSTSKYNPIAHRLFPHLTRACQGVSFPSVELVTHLLANTTTKTGLTVDVRVLDKV
jgi:Rhodopirellula transposase DDE domain